MDLSPGTPMGVEEYHFALVVSALEGDSDTYEWAWHRLEWLATVDAISDESGGD